MPRRSRESRKRGSSTPYRTSKKAKVRKSKRKMRVKKRRYRKGESETLNVRSIAQDFWLTNPVNTDFVGTLFQPWVGKNSESEIDSYANLTNSLIGSGWAFSDCNILTTETRDKYAVLYKYYKVNYFWFKYSPAMTGGTPFALDSSGSEKTSSAVNGQITFCTIRDVQDRDNMTNSAVGNKKLRARKNAKTVSMYKPCFIKFKPSAQITYDTGDTTLDKQRIEYNQSWKTNQFADYSFNQIACSMELPKACGIQQLSVNPFDGTNFPAEGNSVIIGSYTMGASVTFFGKKGQE